MSPEKHSIKEHELTISCVNIKTINTTLKAMTASINKELPGNEEIIANIEKDVFNKLVERVSKSLEGISVESLVKREIKEGKTCKHILIGGINKGLNCKGFVTRNSEYCSTHKKKYNSVDNEPIVVKDKNITFTEYDKKSGTYKIDKTCLVANIKTIDEPIGLSNHVIVGRIDNDKLVALDDKSIEIAIANDLNVI